MTSCLDLKYMEEIGRIGKSIRIARMEALNRFPDLEFGWNYTLNGSLEKDELSFEYIFIPHPFIKQNRDRPNLPPIPARRISVEAIVSVFENINQMHEDMTYLNELLGYPFEEVKWSHGGDYYHAKLSRELTRDEKFILRKTYGDDRFGDNIVMSGIRQFMSRLYIDMIGFVPSYNRDIGFLSSVSDRFFSFGELELDLDIYNPLKVDHNKMRRFIDEFKKSDFIR